MKLKLQRALEPGRYTATLSRIEETESKYGSALRFIYASDGEDEISELVNVRYSSRSKLAKRAEALLGSAPAELDVDSLIGKRCTVVLIEQEDRPEFCRVQSVRCLEDDAVTAADAPVF